jgi:hypothetical protein
MYNAAVFMLCCMAHNVPRVADVPREGYMINVFKKVSPNAACVNTPTQCFCLEIHLYKIVYSLRKSLRACERTATRMLCAVTRRHERTEFCNSWSCDNLNLNRFFFTAICSFVAGEPNDVFQRYFSILSW